MKVRLQMRRRTETTYTVITPGRDVTFQVSVDETSDVKALKVIKSWAEFFE